MNFLKNIKGAKIPLSWMPKFYSDNPPFTQAETKAIDAEISKLLKKWVIELFQESITDLTWWREKSRNMFNKIVKTHQL